MLLESGERYRVIFSKPAHALSVLFGFCQLNGPVIRSFAQLFKARAARPALTRFLFIFYRNDCRGCCNLRNFYPNNIEVILLGASGGLAIFSAAARLKHWPEEAVNGG